MNGQKKNKRVSRKEGFLELSRMKVSHFLRKDQLIHKATTTLSKPNRLKLSHSSVFLTKETLMAKINNATKFQGYTHLSYRSLTTNI